MIDMLEGFPDGVIACRLGGKLTRDEYDRTVLPAVEAGFRRHDKLRVYCEVGEDFEGAEAGAMWEDMKLGLGHLTGWERMAVVSDMDWLSRSVRLFGVILPGEMRAFPRSQAAEARGWICEGKPGPAPA